MKEPSTSAGARSREQSRAVTEFFRTRAALVRATVASLILIGILFGLGRWLRWKLVSP